jgi:hypothetical protein
LTTRNKDTTLLLNVAFLIVINPVWAGRAFGRKTQILPSFLANIISGSILNNDIHIPKGFIA